MANRYWRGGAGTWDTTTTTNWSATSGGAGGASVPTTADSVFFDQAGTYTVTCTGALACNDITVSAGTVTFANGTTPTWNIAGSVSLIAGTVWSATGAKTFTATTAKTITTNGVAFTGDCTFNGVGGSWTLGSALNISAYVITVTNGTFDTSGYSLTCISLVSTTGTRTINLNASTLTLSSTGTAINFGVGGLTFNCGTSQINCTSASSTITGGGQTFYNVSFTSVALTTPSITGANTFNNLSVTGRTTVGIGVFTFSANQTINGTLTLNAGTAAAYRIMLASDTIGTQRTLTCAAISSVTDYDFRDINFAGAISLPVTGTRLGDCKGNSNITFPATKTVYYRQTGSANWGATGTGSWSATSGGALDATMFPLAQDTAVFPASTYPASGLTTTINSSYNIGTIDMSLRTSNTMTLSYTITNPVIYGNWINGTGITNAVGNNPITFAGRTTQQITSAGKSFTGNITINSPSGTVQLQDAFTTATTATTTLTTGTLDLQSYTLSTGLFNSTNSNTRTIAFGTGNITCTGTGNVWTTSTSTNLTTTGTQVVNVTSAGSTAITVTTGASVSEANSIGYNFTGGTYTLNNLSANIFRNLNFTGFAGTWSIGSASSIYGNVIFSAGMTLGTSAQTMTFGATSGTQQITTNGKTLDFPLTFNGVGGTFQLQDALTMGSTRAVTLTNGTLDLNGKTMTVGTRFTTAAGTKNLTFNGGTLVCPDPNTTSFNNAQPTNFTTTAGTGTGTISMTAATAKTFVGGGSTFNCNLNQGGAGDLTITGSNTFRDITNTTQPAFVLFTAGTTTTFTSGFSLSGTAGNLITIGSVTAASHTLSKASGTVSVSYCSISRSTATGGATWTSSTSNGNVDGGNNSGWSFAGGGTVYNVSLSEAGSSTDAFSSVPTYASVVLSSITVTDNVTVAPSIFGTTVSNTATVTDTNSARMVANSAVANTATATQTNATRLTASALVANTATATDAITNAGSIYKSVVTNTATSTDLPSTRQTFITDLTNTVTATDTYSVAATFNSAFYSDLYDFSESTYGFPTGTSFTGSAIWSTTSLSRVQVEANGSGTGTAGFNAGGNYIAIGTGTFGTVRIQTKLINLVDAVSLTINYINGTGSNGGIVPNLVMQIGAYDLGVLTNVLGSVPVTGQSTFGDISFSIPFSSRVVGGSLRFITVVQAGGAAYGIRNITITYASGLTVTDDFSSLPVYSTQILESLNTTSIFVVSPSTFNAPFVDDITAVDEITNAGSIYNAPLIESIDSSDTLNAAFLWNPTGDISESWDAVQDESKSWGDVQDQTESWTVVPDVDDIWTQIGDNSSTWTPSD